MIDQDLLSGPCFDARKAIYIYIYTHTYTSVSLSLCTYIYIYMYVCIYIYIYIHTYTYTSMYTYVHLVSPARLLLRRSVSFTDTGTGVFLLETPEISIESLENLELVGGPWRC